jgi:hypothetical protein
MAVSPFISDTFRNVRVPKEQFKTQKDVYKWVISTFRNEKPIANHEFVFHFRMSRHGGILHTLRQEGWIIETIGHGEKATYKLIAKPHETELQLFHG